MERITKGHEAVDALIRMVFDYVIEIVINLTGMLIIFSFFDVAVTFGVLAFGIIYCLGALLLSRRAAREQYRANIRWEHTAGAAYETVANIRTVKMMALEANLLARVDDMIGKLFEAIRRRIFWYRVWQFSTVMMAEMFRFGAVAVIALGVIYGRYELGFLVLFYAYFNRIWESIHELATVSDQFTKYQFSIQRVIEVLDEPITISDDTGKRHLPEDWQQIGIKNLSFAYDDTKALDDVSLTIRRGEKVGIVGLSGSGKSTLFKLLLKQYEDFSGEILIDETPLQKISNASYLASVATVLQETELFHLSLAENIAIGGQQSNHDDDRLHRAIEVAHIDAFLAKLPKGTETRVGEKGVKLSGGEKQRVGIARAVYKNPQILFLDEATSHLDVESEKNIQAALHQFFQEVTAVVIAHRLSTIKEMDRIVVLENGRVIEEGSFNELMEREGRFFELWQQQLL
jgi:ATP-binding cassette subfamily B protein